MRRDNQFDFFSVSILFVRYQLLRQPATPLKEKFIQNPGTSSTSTPTVGSVVVLVVEVVFGRAVVALNKYGCSSLMSLLDRTPVRSLTF